MMADKPDSIIAHFLFYASALGVTDEVCSIIKNIGAFCLNFGFDSGNDQSLRILKGKKHSVGTNMNAATVTTKHGFDIHTSFVLFGLGDNKSTVAAMNDSLVFANWLINYSSTTTIECALLYPDKASPVGCLIWNPELYEQVNKKYDLSFLDMCKINAMHKKYKDEIFIEPNEIISDFADACGTDVSLLLEFQQRIKECCSSSNIRFGYSQYGKEVVQI